MKGRAIPHLLEREPQLTALAEAVAGAGLREGRLVVIEAAAGVGKTALLESAVESARGAGFLVLQARAVELEQDLPFGVVRQLLSAEAARRPLEGAAALARPALGLAVPDPAVGDPLAAALHGLDSLCAELAARRPVALAVDDVHWADRASLRFMAYLARRLAERPLLVVLATRPSEPGAPQDLIEALVHDCGAEVLRPQELSPAGTASLLEARLPHRAAELSSACYRASGGNPFLISELARELAISPDPPRPEQIAEIAPRTVARSVLRRVARLSTAAQRIARAAALFPDGAPFRHVAALARLDEPEAAAGADELTAAGVLGPTRPLTFLHPLMRTAVYEDITPAARAQAHARAAELLAGEDTAPEDIATHLVATEPRASAATVEVLLRAAERALGIGASETAARYLRRALDEPAPAALRPQLLRDLGLASMRAGEDAIGTLEDALAVAEPGLERAEIANDLARALSFAGRLREAVEAIELAIADVEAIDRDLALRYHTEALWIEWEVDDLVPAYNARLARLPAALTGKTVAQQLVLCHRAWQACTRLEPHDRVVELARRAVGDGRLARLGLTAGGPVAYAVGALAASDRIDDARETNATLIEACRASGELVALPLAYSHAARLALQAGDLPAAETHAHAARDAAASQPGQIGGADQARSVLLVVLTEQGRLDEAARICPDGVIEPTDPVSLELTVARARFWLARGELLSAREALEAAAHWGGVRDHVDLVEELPYFDALAIVLHRLGDADAARRMIVPFLAQARQFGAPGQIGRVLCVAGLVAREEQRRELLEEAVALLDRSPRRLDHAKALMALGTVMRQEGRRAEAREPLRRAIELARQCGSPSLQARAAAELRMARGRVPREERSGLEALTAAELRVAQRAAAGRSNKEIAAELFLTLKTVEMHLTRAYRKLDVRSRRDLSQALEAD